MEVQYQIDRLIENLKSLKPRLTDNVLKNENEFKKVLEVHLADKTNAYNEISKENFSELSDSNQIIPAWVNEEYAYDTRNPRKPNMREMMEALSGQTLEALYKQSDSKSNKIASLSAELLYGTVSESKDNRDWDAIMSAENVLGEARLQNSLINKPEIDIANELDKENKIINQYAIIKDSDGNILKSLSGASSSMKESLKNFGVNSDSIPNNLEQKIVTEKFDRKVLEILDEYKKEDHNLRDSIAELTKNNALRNTLDTIETKISYKIPLEEIEKL